MLSARARKEEMMRLPATKPSQARISAALDGLRREKWKTLHSSDSQAAVRSAARSGRPYTPRIRRQPCAAPRDVADLTLLGFAGSRDSKGLPRGLQEWSALAENYDFTVQTGQH